MIIHRLRAAATAACFALSFGALATTMLAKSAAAEEERIEIGVESMAYDSFFKDCKTRLSVTNKSSLEVHEYRLFMFQLAGGTRVSGCEERFGHRNLAFEKQCNAITKLACEDVEGFELLDLHCLDSEGNYLECFDLMVAVDDRLSITPIEIPPAE